MSKPFPVRLALALGAALCLFTAHPLLAQSRELSAAIRDNNLAKINELLAADPAALNKKIEFHSYPLFVAVTEFKIDCLRLFLDKGAKVDLVDDDGQNVIHQFAKLRLGPTVLGQAKEMLQLLADKKANFNLLDKFGKTPLYLIAGSTERNISKPETMVELLQFLLDKGADVNNRGKDVSPVLVNVVRYGAARGNEEVAFATFKFLLEKGIRVNDADVDGNTALYRVLKPTQPEMELPADKKAEYAALLIDYGADPKQKNLKKETPLSLVEDKASPLYEILRRKPTKAAGGKKK